MILTSGASDGKHRGGGVIVCEDGKGLFEININRFWQIIKQLFSRSIVEYSFLPVFVCDVVLLLLLAKLANCDTAAESSG